MKKPVVRFLFLASGVVVGVALFVIFGVDYVRYPGGATQFTGIPFTWKARGTELFPAPPSELNLALDMVFWIGSSVLLLGVLLGKLYLTYRKPQIEAL